LHVERTGDHVRFSRDAGLCRYLAATALAAAALLLAGCSKDSVSPTEPVPTGNIAGAWTGTFDTADPIDCAANGISQASFQQNGSAVVGTLAVQSDCGFSVTFQGSLKGNALSGAITGGGFYSGSAASGYLSGASLEIGVENSFGLIPGGQMHLHR
jgi:hypothetical protein